MFSCSVPFLIVGYQLNNYGGLKSAERKKMLKSKIDILDKMSYN